MFLFNMGFGMIVFMTICVGSIIDATQEAGWYIEDRHSHDAYTAATARMWLTSFSLSLGIALLSAVASVYFGYFFLDGLMPS